VRRARNRDAAEREDGRNVQSMYRLRISTDVTRVLKPPAAPRRPTVLRAHGDERVDHWYWLRDRDDPEVVSYLQAENAYTEGVMAPTAALQQLLYKEFRSRVEETDATVPARRDNYWYYRRTVKGLPHTIHCRGSDSDKAGEQVLLDENERARGTAYFNVGAFAVSPRHRLVAYTADTAGSQRFTLRVRDLATDRDLADEICDVYYGVAWANDDRTVFYTRPNERNRPWQLWRHLVGTSPEDDALVYMEEDERFRLSLRRSRSGTYLVVSLRSMVTAETWVLNADEPTAELRLVLPRREGVDHMLEHHGDRFLIVTNDAAPNFRLLSAPVDEPHRQSELVPHRPNARLEGVEAFAGGVALAERSDGVRRIRIIDWATGDSVLLVEPEEAHTARPGENLEFASRCFRFEYTSLVTPETVVDVDLESGERTIRKRKRVRGYERKAYASERLWATAPDGERVPISIVYRRDRPKDGSAPLLLYGYGSYEVSVDPTFSALRLSLLDRGFAFAIAHVRGGGELGRCWYERGRLKQKRTTFTDFIACAEHMLMEGWTAPQRLVIRGASAGGLLVGAALTMRPELFGCAVLGVPFVDVLTTMLDESLPLTALERDEWGDPMQDSAVYHLLKSYSPYDNVTAREYPPMLVTAGLHDAQVAYWEPTKFVAKLRALKTDSNRLLLKAHIEAGHLGPSGRYDAWREEAFVYAFILDTLGVAA
jgi:oligopeptidase B